MERSFLAHTSPHLALKQVNDRLTPAQRSYNMSRIRSTDTAPERAVRRLLHRLGYRYRLHSKELPGRPDLAFRSKKKVIFVHGCFWHRHRCAKGRLTPKTNADYWQKKFENNRLRDRANAALLRKMGWRVLVVWECQLTKKRSGRLLDRLVRFLDD